MVKGERKLFKVGNSWAVIIPKAVLDWNGIDVNKPINVSITQQNDGTGDFGTQYIHIYPDKVFGDAPLIPLVGRA